MRWLRWLKFKVEYILTQILIPETANTCEFRTQNSKSSFIYKAKTEREEPI